MKRTLHLGARRFTLAPASLDGALRDLARGDAPFLLALLRRIAAEPLNRAAIRLALADLDAGSVLASIDADEAVRRLAALLTSGRAALVEERSAEPLFAIDGDAPLEEHAGATPEHPEPALTWIEIKLLGQDDLPIPGERYRLELPDGSVREGALDGLGFARIDGLDPGSCVVTFPALDRGAWERA